MEQRGHLAVSGGARIAYTVYGPASDTAVCFCPGLGGTQLGYAADAEHFAERGYRAITFDLRGFGEYPPDVVEPSAFTLEVLARISWRCSTTWTFRRPITWATRWEVHWPQRGSRPT